MLAALATAIGGCSWTDDPQGDSTLDEIRALPGPAPYFVGETFEDLPLTAILGRSLPLTFIYGDCEPPPDGGCATTRGSSLAYRTTSSGNHLGDGRVPEGHGTGRGGSVLRE